MLISPHAQSFSSSFSSFESVGWCSVSWWLQIPLQELPFTQLELIQHSCWVGFIISSLSCEFWEMSCDLLVLYFCIHCQWYILLLKLCWPNLRTWHPDNSTPFIQPKFQNPQRHIWRALFMVADGICPVTCPKHDLFLISDMIRYEQLLFFTQSVTVMKICLDVLTRMCYCQAWK